MKTKHLLMACALPALFAACSQEEALVNVEPEIQNKGKPLENVTLSFNKETNVATRMVNDGWNLKWKAGDQVGLVWVNAPEIQQQFTKEKEYDPTVLPSTAFWASNTRMTCNDPDNNIFGMQDGQVLEGQYFAYYPYSDRYKVDGKFGLSVDAIQSQGSTDLTQPTEVLSYVVDNMPWVSRRVDEQTQETNKNATYIYPLQNEEAGMSKAINMEMFRFANMLDARVTFKAGSQTIINPEKIQIESVDLIVTTQNEDWAVDKIATSGLFDMSKIKRYNKGAYDEFGIPSLSGTSKYALPTIETQEGLFVNDNKVSSITTIIEQPVAKSTGRVNFLLMPYTEKNSYFTKEYYKLALVIHTNYGVVTVEESDWYKSKESDPTGMLVLGPNAVESNKFVKINDIEAFYAGGWAARTGAFCTRFIEVNVDDLEFETNCIKTQNDLLATIERINSRNVTNRRFDLCVDGDDANNVLELTDFDWSAESDNEAIKTFITAGNTLRLKEHSDKQVTIKFNGNNKIGAGQLTNLSNKIDIVVSENAVLDVNADFTTGIFVTEQNSILNVNGAKLTTGVATLNGSTNILVTNEEAGELNVANKSENKGTMEVKGILSFKGNAVVSNTGTINLYYTAQLTGVTGQVATLNNSNVINYYYAKSGDKKNVNITNVEDGQFIAEYNDGIVPGTGDNEKKADFMKNANSYGVTHYIISKASDANSEAWSLTNATKITVKKGVTLTFNPTKASTMGLTASKALLYFEGNNELASTGDYASYAKVAVKDITLAYGIKLTNNVEVVLTGKFQAEVDNNNSTTYTVDNKGYIYGGIRVSQSGTITWLGKEYGVKK